MKASTCSLVAAVGLPVALGWIFPEGLEDGLYGVTLPDPSRNDSKRSEAFVVKLTPFWNETLKHEGWLAEGLAEAPDHGSPGSGPSPRDNGERGHDDEDWDPPPRDPKKHRDKLPVPVSFCSCSVLASRPRAHDAMMARVSLRRYCDKYLVRSHQVLIAVSHGGRVGAFVCNNSDNDQVCSVREYDYVFRRWLDPLCGDLRYGQARSIKWQKWYGRAFPGMPVCPHDFFKVKEKIWHWETPVKEPGEGDDLAADGDEQGMQYE